jgi:isoquinoline 1-oxidoreductase beta subunit
MRTREDVLRDNKLGRHAQPSRRGFLQASLAGSGGLLVVLSWPDPAEGAGMAPGAASLQAPGVLQPNAFVRVDPDDTVTIWSRNPDMGEGVRTSLSMIVAEELDADWPRVVIESAPLDAARYGPQGVGGSDAVASAWDDHRRAGAAARHMLVAAAARRWQVPAGSLTTAVGRVHDASSDRTLTYGALATAAAAESIPSDPPLKEPAAYRLIGTPRANVDNAAIVSGRPLFGLDVRLPGMRFAAVAKCPVFGGRPRTIDDRAARAVPGVRDVVEIRGLENPTHLMPGVAVVADSTWAAFKGRDALIVEWDEGPFAAESSASLDAAFGRLLDAPEHTVHDSGDVEGALADAAHRVDATFHFAFVAHATLEPHNCTAEWRDGDCFITGPLQMPASGRAVVARALGVAPERVHVQSTRIGGGFGRRLLSDYAAEAAVVARAAGAPVQIVATRRDDLQHDYYRPAAAQRIRAGVDREGRVVAWDHVLASVSRNAYRRDPRPPYMTELYGAFIGSVATTAEMQPDLVPTAIPHARLRYGAPATGVPTGAWRAPSHVVNAFAIESVIDELAALARRSPVDIRLELLGDAAGRPQAPAGFDPARMARVIVEAADRGGLGARPAEGRARALAAHFTFGSYCAQVAEISVESDRRVVVHRVTAVGDVGQPVNPSGLEAQAQGGIIDGLGAAFFCEVPIERGRAVPSNFDDYRLIRHREAPAVVALHLVPSTRRPTGFGEIAIPPIAPAVANAIAALTDERLRAMPFAARGYTLAPARP